MPARHLVQLKKDWLPSPRGRWQDLLLDDCWVDGLRPHLAVGERSSSVASPLEQLTPWQPASPERKAGERKRAGETESTVFCTLIWEVRHASFATFC